MIESTRTVTITFSGDGLNANHSFPAADNTSTGIGQIPFALTAGDNLIQPPFGAGACTILPAGQNTSIMAIKGLTTDKGITIHLTDPCTISLRAIAPTFTADPFYINSQTGALIRIIWS